MTTAQFPTLTVELGLGSAPANTWIVFQPSNVTTTAAGFDTFTFGAGVAFTDVTADVRDLQTHRGRQRSADRFAAGACTFTLDDTTGSYFGNANLVPNVKVQVHANWQGVDYWLFAGYVDSITPNWTAGQYSYSTITITATDAFKPLQAYKPPTASAPIGAGDDTGARVNRILDEVATFTTNRDIDTGNSTLQATTLSQSALDDIYAAVDSELGQFYVTGNGAIRFENRQYRLTNPTSYASQVTLADSYQDSNYLIETAPVTLDATLVQNRVTGQNTGGTAQTVSDTTSITANFTVDYSNTSLILQTDADALHWADWRLWLYKNARKRVDSATIRPVGDPANLWPEVLGREFSDRVTVALRPPRGSAYSGQFFVEGIDHQITTAPQDWVTTYHLSDASQTTNMLLFDVAGHDVFDTNTFAEF